MKHILVLSLICLASYVSSSHANDESASLTPAVAATQSNKPIVIESQVTGTQEQPKVLYIMPWQGINTPIEVKDNNLKMALPSFAPINPKTFQKEVRDFNANQVVE